MLYIFDKSTGSINRRVNAPIEEGELNCLDGEGWIFSDLVVSDSEYYVFNGELTAYPVRPTDYHVWDWSLKEWAVNQSVIDAKKRDLKFEIDAIRQRKSIDPIEYQGFLFDADETAIKNISAWQTQITAGAVLPDGFTWRDYNNNDHPANTDFVNGLGVAITLRGTQLYQSAWRKKAEIEAITSFNDLTAYDVNIGW